MPDILDSDQAPTFCGFDLYQNWLHTCTLSATSIISSRGLLDYIIDILGLGSLTRILHSGFERGSIVRSKLLDVSQSNYDRSYLV